MEETRTTTLLIPTRLVSPTDLGRVLRELEALDDTLRQASLRRGGTTVNLPKTTRTLEDLSSLNKCSLLEENSRVKLLELLRQFFDNYPKIHMSFTVEPSARFVENIILWLRKNIHPQILLDIGLQPSIAAGCVVRTTNKVFDMSLRHSLRENRHFLIEKLGGSGGQ